MFKILTLLTQIAVTICLVFLLSPQLKAGGHQVNEHIILDEYLQANKEDFTFELNEEGKPGKYQINGTRYGDPQGEPWILCHGFLQTEYSMLEYMQELVGQGKNVFVINEVGFGLEGRRSLLRPGVVYQKGDYGFKGIIEGISQAVSNVNRITGQKVVLLGFSMGAMGSREYIEGTYAEDTDGMPMRSEELAFKRQKLLKHAILVGGPPDTLEGMTLMFNIASVVGYNSLNSLAKDFNGFISMGLGGSAVDLHSSSVLIKSVGVMKRLGLSSAARFLFRDGGDLKNYGSKENIFAQILRFEFSNPHSDIVRSFMRKTKLNNKHPMMIGSREKMQLTVVAAQDDGFVSVDSHFKEFEAYYKNNPKATRAIMVSEAGHLDLTGEVVVHQTHLIENLILRTDDSKRYDLENEKYQVVGEMNSGVTRLRDTFLAQFGSQHRLSCRDLFF